jgi:hypothetical protein
LLVISTIHSDQAQYLFAVFAFSIQERIFMTQAQLNRAVAHATGETVGLVEHRGFNLVIVPETVGRPSRSSRRRSRRRWWRCQRASLGQPRMAER